MAALFELEKDGETLARLTSWEQAIYTQDGHIWQPARVEADSIIASIDPSDDRAKITLNLDDLPGDLPHRIWISEEEAP